MDMNLDEQTLLTDFRRMDDAGRRELLDYAVFLVKKHRDMEEAKPTPPGNQCRLEQKTERPETAKEPIFTE
ncbi:MAG: hypothetical protein WA140_11920 [Geobacteraceae bacterium]